MPHPQPTPSPSLPPIPARYGLFPPVDNYLTHADLTGRVIPDKATFDQVQQLIATHDAAIITDHQAAQPVVVLRFSAFVKLLNPTLVIAQVLRPATSVQPTP